MWELTRWRGEGSSVEDGGVGSEKVAGGTGSLGVLRLLSSTL